MVERRNQNPITDLYFKFNRLKRLERQGWLRSITSGETESVAEHSFGSAVLTLFIVSEYFPHLDAFKMAIMSLFHETPEIYTGDPTPGQIPLAEKERRERKAVKRIFPLRKQKKFAALWEEYAEGKTEEAKLVRQIQYLEMALQAKIYEKEHHVDLSEFIETAREKISEEKLVQLLEEISRM
ncbi:HD domain-containing protein [Candidatus Roizmanbacteria bacterium]|nr:HD domain-containing protein [Candidatus Roizmanbacteria bacterium]